MPERVTEYEYDERDRLVRSREWVESPWDEQQRAWMLALDVYEATLCPHCGGPPSICQSPDADRNNPRAKWIYWPVKPAECAITTAHRIGSARQDPEDKRALVPQVVRVQRGTPKPTDCIV